MPVGLSLVILATVGAAFGTGAVGTNAGEAIYSTNAGEATSTNDVVLLHAGMGTDRIVHVCFGKGTVLYWDPGDTSKVVFNDHEEVGLNYTRRNIAEVNYIATLLGFVRNDPAIISSIDLASSLYHLNPITCGTDRGTASITMDSYVDLFNAFQGVDHVSNSGEVVLVSTGIGGVNNTRIVLICFAKGEALFWDPGDTSKVVFNRRQVVGQNFTRRSDLAEEVNYTATLLAFVEGDPSLRISSIDLASSLYHSNRIICGTERGNASISINNYASVRIPGIFDMVDQPSITTTSGAERLLPASSATFLVAVSCLLPHIFFASCHHLV